MKILREIPTYFDRRLEILVLVTLSAGFAFAHWNGLRVQKDFPFEYTMQPFAYSIGFSEACLHTVLAIILSTFVVFAAYRFRWDLAKRLVIQFAILNTIFGSVSGVTIMLMFALQT